MSQNYIKFVNGRAVYENEPQMFTSEDHRRLNMYYFRKYKRLFEDAMETAEERMRTKARFLNKKAENEEEILTLQAETTMLIDDNKVLENKIEDLTDSINYWRDEAWRLEAKVKEFQEKLEDC